MLLRAVLEDLFGEVVLDAGLVAQHLEICVLQQLRARVAQLLTNGLLHARIVQLALSRGILSMQLVDRVADGMLPANPVERAESR